MVASQRLSLVQETAGEYGFVVFLPVYKKGLRSDTSESYRKYLRGFILGVFRIGDIVKNALDDKVCAGIDFSIYDMSAPKENRHLYLHRSQLSPKNTAQEIAEGPFSRELFRQDKTLNVAGREWKIVYTATPGYAAFRGSWRPWGVFFVGLAFTGLGAGFLWSNLRRMQSFADMNTLLLAEVKERERAQEGLHASERLYRTFINATNDLVFLKDEKLRYVMVNDASLKFYKKTLDDVLGRTVFEFAPENVAESCGQSDMAALESGTFIITEEIIGDRVYEAIKFPVRLSGDKVGVGGYIRDITERKQAQENIKQAMEKLRKTLTGTIQAVSLIVEMKDPYTAGHQRRVSRLASAIAQEMGLPADVIDSVRTAGVLHDIGKISVPSEILSKPTHLTDIEFELIKVHARSGYSILKDAELPHSIAKIVLQHHERLEGSGYPDGLKGDEILLEARILGIADTVEAIASHRPYRPGHGINIALEEIEKNKGILYDADAVDACCKLFREKRFSFETTES
jgi:PAS domain S-box-containing protein/putative nucleotidyltransferase with HDIG domain